MRSFVLLFTITLPFVTKSGLAQSMFDESKANLKQLPKITSAAFKWARTIDPALLKVSYLEGESLAISAESLRKDLQRLDRIATVFSETPSVFLAFQVVRALDDVERSFDRLIDFLGTVRTPSAESSNCMYNWLMAGKPSQGELKAFRFNFNMAYDGSNECG